MNRLQANLSVIVVGIGLMLMVATRDGVPGIFSQPSPINAPGLNLLIVEESEDTDDLPRGQQEILGTVPFLKGWSYRIDDPTDPEPNDLQHWQDAMKRPRTTLPWVIISNGSTGFEGPLPATLPEFEKLLVQYGGQGG